MKTPLHYLFAATALVTVPAMAQIPNGGFENWSTVSTYQDPDNWLTYNQVTTSSGAELSCEKGTPGAVGSAYVKVTTRNVPGIGVIAGTIIASGGQGQTSFPFTSRPEALNGQWQYAIMPNDGGIITVLLTKYNNATGSDDFVGIGGVSATGSLTGWQAFSIPITYSSADIPDKAQVIISSSAGTGVAGSTMSIDDLSFGAAAGIDEQNAMAGLVTYPSVTSDLLNVVAKQLITEVSMLDMTGRMVRDQLVNGQDLTFNVSDLHTGRYLMQVRMADGKRLVRSFVKQ